MKYEVPGLSGGDVGLAGDGRTGWSPGLHTKLPLPLKFAAIAMSVLDQLKEIVAPGSAEAGTEWAAQWFAPPDMEAAGEVAEAVAKASGAGMDRLTGDTLLVEDLEMNELQRVKLFVALEQAFRVTISDLDAARIRSVRHLVDCIQAKRQNPAANSEKSADPGPEVPVRKDAD